MIKQDEYQIKAIVQSEENKMIRKIQDKLYKSKDKHLINKVAEIVGVQK